MLELKAISAKERPMRGLLYGFAAALFALGGVWPARADEKPILQLDTGGHMAIIKGLTFTPNGEQLVSASDDKVIRVWDVATGKTLRTIRGEIAPGDAGKIFAMALSPDGKWLAAGGYAGTFTGSKPREDEEAHKIRLYDFASGELKALLKGHENVVFSLAFSPDGTRLISGSADKTAIIWGVSPVTAPGDGAKAAPTILMPLHRLQGHTAQIYAVGFSPDGARAVTGAYDNDLRLWHDADGQEIAVMKGHADKVRSVAVAPDGTIASGDASGEIRLWNGETGAFLRTLAQQRRGVGSLSFSPDGRTLLSGFGAGSGVYGCHVWDIGTGHERATYGEHDNTVFATTINRDGRWAATGNFHGEIHIWDLRTGKRRAAPDSTPLTLSGTGKPAWAAGFSADGKAIGWGNQNSNPGGTTPANDRGPLQFALALPLGSENLGTPTQLGEAAAKNFRRAVDEQDGWSLAHRKGGAYGYNAILGIKQGERVAASIERGPTDGYRHRSYSFTPDGQTIISGGNNGFLAAYDRAGKMLGDFVGHESEVWAVAISPDGKYLVSGSADQTVRLWDAKTRALLATLFRGSDGEWVIWTPEGFFAGSDKGAERVGWHINQGPDKEARYVTGAQLRKFFFRPDLVAEKIKGDPDGKVRDAAAKINVEALLKIALAPAVEILSPAPRAFLADAKVTVTARIRNTGGGIGAIRFKVNGQAVERAYGALTLETDGRISREFDLANEVSTIEVVAATPAGVESLAASVTVKADPKAIAGIPDLYVLAIGADRYRDARKSLSFAVKDASELARALKEAGTSFYRHPPKVVELYDGDVTPEKVGAAFQALGQEVKATDVFVFYMAGHGKTVDGDFYFLPPSLEAFSEAAIKAKGFGPSTLPGWFEAIKAQKSIWIFDTCESGSAERLFRIRDATAEDAAYQRLKSATGRTLFMAASEEQAALEGYGDHGVFTYALLEGLAKAGSGERVQLFDLADYVGERVPELSRALKSCGAQGPKDYCQKPLVPIRSTNYPLVPRYPAILTRLGGQGVSTPTIGQKPTHVVIAAAELFETANRGGQIKRQLKRGELVTLIKAASGWAQIAKDGKLIGYAEEDKLIPIAE
jgi:WD40 repeat protein